MTASDSARIYPNDDMIRSIASKLGTTPDVHGLVFVDAVAKVSEVEETHRYVIVDVDDDGARVGLYEGDDDRAIVFLAGLTAGTAVSAATALTSAYVQTREG